MDQVLDLQKKIPIENIIFLLENNFPLFQTSCFQGVPFTVVPHPNRAGGIQSSRRCQEAAGAAGAESVQLRTQIHFKV